MDYQTLKYEIDDGLLLLTLNRPENLNAFTVQMANELVAAYERASVDDAVRVGVGDNPAAARGRSNRELVMEVVSLAAEYGRVPARPADVLRLCGVGYIDRR